MNRQPRISAVVAAEKALTLEITWTDGSMSKVDLSTLVSELEVLAPLEDAAFFMRVRKDTWGWGVKWSRRIELSADTLWRLALEQSGETETYVRDVCVRCGKTIER